MRYLSSKILFVFAVIFMLITSVTYGQIIRCGVQDLSPEQVQQLRETFDQWLGKGNMVAEGVIITIPVSFHIIRYDNGSADVTDQQIYDQISVLNSSYANTNFRFSLNSIERVNNTYWTTHLKGSQQEIQMKQTLADDPPHILNFYTCGNPKDGQGNSLFGYATFPWMYSEDNFMLGVVVLYSSLPGGGEPNYNEGDTGTHEIGHFLGVFHTFQGSPDGCTDPGDDVDDTPYEQSPAYGCPEGRNTCPQPGDDPIHNFMDYTYDSCMDHFTAGQATRMDEIMSQYHPSMLTSDVNITIDQRNSLNQQVGVLKKWEGSNWGNNFNPGTPFNFPVNSEQIILGDQTIISNQKYHRWVRNSVNESNDINHHSFIIQSFDNNFTSRFESTQAGITIKNNIESSSANGGNIQFRDPWLIDYPDPAFGNTLRNRGMTDAVFYSRTSPFLPDYTSSYNGKTYKGVFLNQPYTGNNPVYYSVKVDEVQSIDLGGTIGTRNFYFQNWSADPPGSAVFQNEDALETPVVFKSDGATVQANLKGHLLTNSPTATAPNNQRKIVQGSNGYWAMVYVSMGEVWLSRSTDGTNWEKEIMISNGFGEAFCPSISVYGNYAIVLWQEIDWYGSGNGFNNARIKSRLYSLI
ncbi:MAG: zinc metalloprotease [Ignavibacteriaceae bacterium]